MLNTKIFSQITDKLSEALPLELKVVKADLQQHFHDILQAQFAKLDLVTREELDVQTKVLLRTREKLTQLEKKINELTQQK